MKYNTTYADLSDYVVRKRSIYRISYLSVFVACCSKMVRKSVSMSDLLCLQGWYFVSHPVVCAANKRNCYWHNYFLYCIFNESEVFLLSVKTDKLESVGCVCLPSSINFHPKEGRARKTWAWPNIGNWVCPGWCFLSFLCAPIQHESRLWRLKGVLEDVKCYWVL